MAFDTLLVNAPVLQPGTPGNIPGTVPDEPCVTCWAYVWDSDTGAYATREDGGVLQLGLGFRIYATDLGDPAALLGRVRAELTIQGVTFGVFAEGQAVTAEWAHVALC